MVKEGCKGGYVRKFRETMDRRQKALMPASIEEYVSAEDVVRYVDQLVDEMDLGTIEGHYSYNGRPAYHPRVLVKILIYGKMRGIRSSRELSRATQENLRFIFLADNEKPDFRTIINFRKRFHSELGGLFRQTIEIGLREEIITLEHVCIDGTKIRAFAGRNSFKEPSKLKELLEQLEEEAKRSFEEDIKVDEEEDTRHGDSDGVGTLPAELQNREAMREKIKKALRVYESIEGKKPTKISVTDPESRYMKSKGTLPSYNAQVAIDHDSEMAVGGMVTNCCTDNGQLKPMLEEIEEETSRNPKVVSVDKGYADHEGLVEAERRGIDGYIPGIDDDKQRYGLKDFEYDEASNSYRCPGGRMLRFKHQSDRRAHYECEDCSGCPYRGGCLRFPERSSNRILSVSIYAKKVAAMRVKVKTEHGKAMIRIRGSTVEPAIGQIKYCRGLRQFIFRGIEMVDSMWKLELAAYNIGKLARRFMRGSLATCSI